MERAVKERLIGAAVLMAAAIVLIPEMLSGPDREPPPGARTAPGEAPIKTYTIDLNQAPGAPVVESGAMDNRAPPPEESQPRPEPAGASSESMPAASTQGMPESPSVSTPSRGNESTTASTRAAPPPTAPVVEPRTPVETRPAAAAPAIASTPGAPRSGAWAVQVGSFSRQATAERLAKELQGQGQDAFVMPVKSGSGTLYRVRIGPMQDRASAEATLRKVKSATTGAAIVPHP